jgi:hypothetical protein
MDETRFDTLTRRLGRVSTRRGVLGGVLGSTFALLNGSAVLADRGRFRRRKDNRSGKDEPETIEEALPEGVLAGGIWDETLTMCHFDPETGDYEVLPVSTTSVPEYLERGDTLFIDCCVASECGSRPCLTLAGCIEGACAYDATVNAQCDLGNGAMGICRSDGVCVPVSTGVEVAEVAVG